MNRFSSAPLQLKFSANGSEAGSFTGYASTYGGAPDSYGDIIAPGAYAKSLARHDAAGTRPAMIWQHDQANPVGVWLKFDDTEDGLVAHGKLTLDVPQAKSAHSLMRDGALALSIGYTVPSGGAEIVGGARLLKEIDLVEVSLVALPANTNARITAVKSMAECETSRDFEALVRDALGLSRRQAKTLTGLAWPALSSRDGEEAGDNEQVLAALKAASNTIRGFKNV